MYAIGEIDEGGFIYASLYRDREMMHLETRVPDSDLPYATLNAAKEDFTDPFEGCSGLILDYNEEGAVECLWCYPSSLELIQARVKHWAGCYGTWRIRRLNEPVPAV